MRIEQEPKQVAASCPVCRMIIPMFTLRVSQTGFLGRKVHVEVEGEATDCVTHLWSHSDLR